MVTQSSAGCVQMATQGEVRSVQRECLQMVTQSSAGCVQMAIQGEARSVQRECFQMVTQSFGGVRPNGHSW